MINLPITPATATSLRIALKIENLDITHVRFEVRPTEEDPLTYIILENDGKDGEIFQLVIAGRVRQQYHLLGAFDKKDLIKYKAYLEVESAVRSVMMGLPLGHPHAVEFNARIEQLSMHVLHVLDSSISL